MRTVHVSLTPPFSRFGLVPAAQGMYDPADEKDACGLAMVATLRGTAGHDIITAALDALRHLEHRGAVGSDAGTGDGAGIITHAPAAREGQAPTRRARGIRGARGHRMARGAGAARGARHAGPRRHARRAAAL